MKTCRDFAPDEPARAPAAAVTVLPWLAWLAVVLLGAGWAQVTKADDIFFDGFENGLVGWQVGDSNPAGTPAYWGVVAASFGGAGTHSGTNSLYCAANGYAGTAAHPQYQGAMAAYAMRSLDLSGYTNATLSFWYRIPSIETNYDFARVYMDDTELWSQDTAQGEWTQANLSLNTFVGGVHTLSFQFSSDFSGNYEGWYIDDVLVTDASIPGPPRTNDNFSAAEPLVGANGSVAGSNRQATSEPGEPSSGYASTNSVWFRWSTITNGQVTFSTAGSAFPTILCVYTGTNLSSLALVGSDGNSSANGASHVVFEAVAGVPYWISVRGVGDAAGPILLSWSQPNVNVVDLLPDLVMWADPAQNYLYGWYLDRTQLPGHTLMRISTATANVGTGPLEVFGSSSSPDVYQRIYRNDGSSYVRYAGTFSFDPEHGHLHFDDWSRFNLRSVLPGDGVGEIVVAGEKTSSAIIDLQIYDSGLPGHPAASQYHGGFLQGLSVGWADVYGADIEDQWMDITGVGPGRYWLEEIADPDNHIVEANETNNLARILIELTPGELNGETTNGTSSLPPVITGQPLATNLVQGSSLHLSVTAGGEAPLSYQWRHAGVELTNDERVSGATLASLTVTKLTQDDAGPYTVVVTNAYGAITSAPANLIVLDNPRAVYIADAAAALGGTVVVPIEMLAAGDEHAVNFSLIFNPTVLSYSCATNGAGAAGAAILLNTNEVPNGSLGIRIVLPGAEAVTAGLGRELTRVLFSVSGTAGDGTTTDIGFGDEPLPRSVAATNGAAVFPVFAAGRFTVQGVPTILSARYLPEGQIQVSMRGVPGRDYAIEASEELSPAKWVSVMTNRASLEGSLQFNDPQAPLTKRFYRARLLPRTP